MDCVAGEGVRQGGKGEVKENNCSCQCYPVTKVPCINSHHLPGLSGGMRWAPESEPPLPWGHFLQERGGPTSHGGRAGCCAHWKLRVCGNLDEVPHITQMWGTREGFKEEVTSKQRPKG